MADLKIGFAGNPNVGKTTLFNQLTGMNQHVGNWPGKTVEKAEGHYDFNGRRVNVVDLPGNYALSAHSIEEIVSRDFIVDEDSDVIVNVVDASNLERNLYLTVQMMELGANLVLASNMNKFAQRKGYEIKYDVLSELLGVPVIEIEANSNIGINRLLETIEYAAEHPVDTVERLVYGPELFEHLTELQEVIDEDKNMSKAPSRWIAIKLLENDEIVLDMVENSPERNRILKTTDDVRSHLESIYGESCEEIIANARYANLLGEWIISILGHSMLSSFLVDGVIGGLGGVLVFVPQIAILFFIISFLEDSGYLARAAFVMDWVMHKLVGLHGKAFIPMILGFGCGVPGIMATRTMEHEKDRIITMFLIPFMSCSARYPVYLLLVGAFFVESLQGIVIFSLYLIGILVAIIVAYLLKKTMFKDLSAPFVMELPDYKLPTAKGILMHTWEKSYGFVRKAGTIILAAAVVIWILSSFPAGVDYGSQESFIGMIGTAIAPVFAPLGFGSWQASVSILFGLVAKEVVVSTFSSLFGVAEGSFAMMNAMHGVFTPLSAYSFMVFVLLYVPCFATLATVKQETGGWKWPMVMTAVTIITAFIVSFAVYNIGLLLGFA